MLTGPGAVSARSDPYGSPTLWLSEPTGVFLRAALPKRYLRATQGLPKGATPEQYRSNTLPTSCQHARSRRGSGSIGKRAYAGSACFLPALDFGVGVRYLELPMIASTEQLKTPERKGSLPRIKQYTGEAVYIYAFDVAYEMTRKPVRELLGREP